MESNVRVRIELKNATIGVNWDGYITLDMYFDLTKMVMLSEDILQESIKNYVKNSHTWERSDVIIVKNIVYTLL